MNTAAVSAPKPAAPKSGYLATLERAKAAQEAAKQMGGIKHVRKEKMTRRDREKMQAEAAATAKNAVVASKSGKSTPTSRSRSAEPTNLKPGEVKKERKPIEVGYKGTIRPTANREPSYRGTMQSGRPPVSTANRARPGVNPRRTGYTSYSDEEEDEEDDERDYDSESDMEAGLDDLDQEELQSARIARKEDEQALKEENELKRQKAERKRKVEALAAAAAAKKKRY